MKNIERTSTLSNADKQEIIRISAAHFAEGHITDAYISHYLNTKNSFILIYRENKKVCAYAICTQWDKTQLFDYVENHPVLTQNYNQTEKVQFGVIKTIAVQPKLQQKGIGSALFSEAERQLQQQAINFIIVPAWIYDDVINIQTMVKKNGYIKWFVIKDFWHSFCYRTNFKCPKKQNNICICGMLMYKKALIF